MKSWQRSKGFGGLFLIVVICLLVTLIPLKVCAKTITQDGLEVSLITDQKEYSKEEKIAVTLVVTNTNKFEVTNVSLESLIPNGYMISDDADNIKNVKTLKPGKSLKLSVVFSADITGKKSEVKRFPKLEIINTGNKSKEDEKVLKLNTVKESKESSISEILENAQTEDVSLTTKENINSADDTEIEEQNDIFIYFIVFLIAVILLVIFLIIKKTGKRFFSMFMIVFSLCTIMMGSMNVLAKGEKSAEKSISINRTIKVAGKERDISAQVCYHLGETKKDSEHTVKFDLNYKEAPTFLSLTVENGAYVDRPEDPDRDKYIFAGWYSDKKYSNYFEFESVPVTEDITLFARWLNIEDKKDTDDDGIVDALEEYFGTDKTKADTDGDGLSDYVEIDSLGLDPRKKDTDDNGITDDKEDTDGDGLTNLQEMKQGTNPISADTDNDGLNDNDEVNKYDTNALKSDTDGDGVSDGKEVEMGTNPLVAEDTFDVKFVVDNEDTVTASVEIELEGNQVESLNVEQVDNDTLFPEGMPGYIGGAYDFNVDGTFDKATISFEFDAGLLGNEDFDPIIYYFNEEEQELEELQTNLNGNVASAVVNHFSKYILVNRKVYQSSFMWTDVWDTNNYTGVEIILVMDDSGSMESNDRRNSRLSVAQTLIDNLPKDSKVGVVKFESRTSLLTKKLTTDRDKAKSYLTTQHFFSSGGTYMYSAIRQSLTLFESEDDRILKMMVVLSDGDTADTRMHNSVITDANNAGVKIYTVGLGNTTSYFYGYLQPLAVNTGAKFYLASKAEELGDIYNDIKEKIDIETDSDQDGIPDYYEENMPIFNGVRLMLDKNNPDTDGDGLLDGEEIVELKYKYNSDRTKVSVTGKLKSNPASKDSDGDGLYDNEYRIAGGKKVAPVDPEPLKPNGPKGMWNSHVLSQSEKQVPVRYSSDSGLDLGVDQEIADVIVKMVLVK